MEELTIRRGEGAREEYEEQTRDVRMGLYSRVCQETGARGVMLAHHLDDAIENVISNVIFPRNESSIFDAGFF